MFLNEFLVTVSSSELSAFEHRKLWCLQTLCWLHGERSLPIGLLVLFGLISISEFWTVCQFFTVVESLAFSLEYVESKQLLGAIAHEKIYLCQNTDERSKAFWPSCLTKGMMEESLVLFINTIIYTDRL